MVPITASSLRFRLSLPFVALCLLLVVLWLAGGASRGDAAGQVVVRATSFLVVTVLVVFGPRPKTASVGPVAVFLGAAILVAILQTIPLPAELWQTLPGHEIGGDVAEGRAADLWRCWSLVPGATLNALVALIVPLAVLLAATALTRDEKASLPGLVLAVVVASMLLGMLQFSGAAIDNPFVNDSSGSVSGTFANRNHFALFLALGCLLVPAWIFREGARVGWRGPVGIGLLLLFTLTILASGSRAGIVLGVLAIVLAGALGQRGLRRALRNVPRWVFSMVVAAIITLLASFVLISVAADRALSIQRSLTANVEQDMRSRALSTVWSMIRDTFPAGSGLGGFDAKFRIYEPFALLKPTYFNQAHNDLIGVLLDAGLSGLLLLAAGLLWWGWVSIKAWRDRVGHRSMLPRLGSAMLLLVIAASAFDYPVRTPLMMAIVVLAAIWLADRSVEDGSSALPRSDRHL